MTSLDSDTAGLTVALAATVAESGTLTGTVTRNTATTAALTVSLASDKTGQATVPATVTIAAGQASKTFTFSPVDDAVVDGAHDVTVTATAAGHANGQDTVAVTDDDVAGVTVTPTTGLTTIEADIAGHTATFTVALTSQPTADVTIYLESDSPWEGTVAPDSLTFTSTDWNTAQNVTVTGVSDYWPDGNQTYNITTSASSADSSYNNISVADVALTSLDSEPDEPGEPEFSNVGQTTLTVHGPALPARATSLTLLLHKAGNWSAPWTTVATGLGANATTAVEDLESGTAYYFYYLAIGAGGSMEGWTMSVVTLPATPEAPTFSAITATTLDVTAPEIPRGGVVMLLQRKLAAEPDTEYFDVDWVYEDEAVTHVTGLSPGTAYRFRYVVFNDEEGGVDGEAATATTEAVTPEPTPTPTPTPEVPGTVDARIRNSADVTYLGDDVFNATGANQTKSQTVDGATASYVVRLENEGSSEDTLTVRGPAGADGWTVHYFDAATGGTDITADVTGDGYETAALAANATFDLRIEVTAGEVEAGATQNVLLTATSNLDGANLDAVKAVTSALAPTPTPEPPGGPHIDLLLRNAGETSFAGNDVYELPAIAQSKAQNVTTDAAAVYELQVQNDAGDARSVVLKGGAGGSGWTVRYFDKLQGGSDITASITTGGGWATGLLSEGMVRQLRVEVTPDGTVAVPSTKTVQLTARVIGQTADSDAVKVVTTKTSETLAAPMNLTAVSGDAEVQLDWPPVVAATGYKLYRALSADGPWTLIASPALPTCRDMGLTNGTTYYYKVSAVNRAGEGPKSAIASATPIRPEIVGVEFNLNDGLGWRTVPAETDGAQITLRPYQTVGLRGVLNAGATAWPEDKPIWTTPGSVVPGVRGPEDWILYQDAGPADHVVTVECVQTKTVKIHIQAETD